MEWSGARVVGEREALAHAVAEAGGDGQPLRIVGGGSWMDAGRPCHGEPLRVGDFSGVIEYVPGDLVLTARAGTTLAEIDTLTSVHGQWIGIDPPAAASATIGATIATASDGPLAVSNGRMRDIVLGLECISGTGELIRAGGRVVKNVAGFDLVRLFTGAWGTLGAITEVSVRLRTRPQVDRTFVVAEDPHMTIESRLALLTEIAAEPAALELINGAFARALGASHDECILVRLAGTEGHVRAQEAALRNSLSVREIDSAVFTQIATVEPAGSATVRVSHLPTLLSATWRHVVDHLTSHVEQPCWLRASVARGTVRVILADAFVGATRQITTPPEITGTAALVRQMAPPGAHAAWERLPAPLWPLVPSSVTDSLSSGLRARLDPAHILNRGLLGEPT